MDSEEFRRLGHQVVDWIANYRERVAGRMRSPKWSPGECSHAL
jgi:hypothetical protein